MRNMATATGTSPKPHRADGLRLMQVAVDDLVARHGLAQLDIVDAHDAVVDPVEQQHDGQQDRPQRGGKAQLSDVPMW